MKMDKNTKILLGVGALAVVGYFIYKNNNSSKASATGMRKATRGAETTLGNQVFTSMDINDEGCKCHTDVKTLKRSDGSEHIEYTCGNGEHSKSSKGCCNGKKTNNCM